MIASPTLASSFIEIMVTVAVSFVKEDIDTVGFSGTDLTRISSSLDSTHSSYLERHTGLATHTLLLPYQIGADVPIEFTGTIKTFNLSPGVKPLLVIEYCLLSSISVIVTTCSKESPL